MKKTKTELYYLTVAVVQEVRTSQPISKALYLSMLKDLKNKFEAMDQDWQEETYTTYSHREEQREGYRVILDDFGQGYGWICLEAHICDSGKCFK